MFDINFSPDMNFEFWFVLIVIAVCMIAYRIMNRRK